MPLRWADHVTGEFLVMISVVVENGRGVLATLASTISDADGNIDDIHVDDREGHYYKVTFKLLIRDRSHLAQILKNIRQIPQVVRITKAK